MRLTNFKREQRKEANGKAVNTIYAVGASLFPADYLIRNQSEPERVAKVKAQAEERRQRRNAKRLRAHRWAETRQYYKEETL